mmetsp:Transcript_9140/g.22411  ORF Transcript_9140/g.22411 Transcript_9140/m.22411 type:complete len:161 (+) Transcript_9140:57-539(+)
MSKSESAQAAQLIQKCAAGGFFPSRVWWAGMGEKIRPTAEPDQYDINRRVDKAAWNDAGRSLLFGPDQKTKSNPYPIWSHTIVKTQQRLNPPQERKPPHYFTQPDQYEVRHKDTMMARAASAIAFPKQNHVQDLKKYVKSQTVNRAFNRDFTRSGSCLAF